MCEGKVNKKSDVLPLEYAAYSVSSVPLEEMVAAHVGPASHSNLDSGFTSGLARMTQAVRGASEADSQRLWFRSKVASVTL